MVVVGVGVGGGGQRYGSPSSVLFTDVASVCLSVGDLRVAAKSRKASYDVRQDRHFGTLFDII